jgi:hypothetical protein
MCHERGKKYHFQKGGINNIFRPKYRPLEEVPPLLPFISYYFCSLPAQHFCPSPPSLFPFHQSAHTLLCTLASSPMVSATQVLLYCPSQPPRRTLLGLTFCLPVQDQFQGPPSQPSGGRKIPWTELWKSKCARGVVLKVVLCEKKLGRRACFISSEGNKRGDIVVVEVLDKLHGRSSVWVRLTEPVEKGSLGVVDGKMRFLFEGWLDLFFFT